MHPQRRLVRDDTLIAHSEERTPQVAQPRLWDAGDPVDAGERTLPPTRRHPSADHRSAGTDGPGLSPGERPALPLGEQSESRIDRDTALSDHT
jgi:hypothetical protein